MLDKVQCSPEYCPRAKGHYDRINEALYDLVTQEDRMTRECTEARPILPEDTPGLIATFPSSSSPSSCITLGEFEEGLYNITFKKNGKARCDIYVNGAMVGNNIDQSGEGRKPSSGSVYTQFH